MIKNIENTLSIVDTMKLALEALENMTKIRDCQREKGYPLSDADKRMQTAVTAIKEALSSPDGEAQPEQCTYPNCNYPCINLPDCKQPETLAWPCVIEVADFEEDTVTLKMQSKDYSVGVGLHWLSTTLPQRTAAEGEDTRRAWVGLTDEEIDKAWRSVDYTVPWEQHRIDIAQAIEAKLKEKNTNA